MELMQQLNTKPGYDNLMLNGFLETGKVPSWLIVEDIDMKVREMTPYATPILELTSKIGRGAPPKNHKIQQIRFDHFDPYDRATSVVPGTGVWTRFARLTMAQASRPTSRKNGLMFYQPQDRLRLLDSDQVVEVVMTSSSAIKDGAGGYFGVPESLAGTGTSETTLTYTCAPGTIIVKTVNPRAFDDTISSTDTIWLGYTLAESQEVSAEPRLDFPYYEYNFVEHKEITFGVTEDQIRLQSTKIDVSLNAQQKRRLSDFKQAIERNLIYGERSMQTDRKDGKAKRSMGGLLDTIHTNVTYYNPDSTTDFENFLLHWGQSQAFKYRTPGLNVKYALAGKRFLTNFNLAFKDYRRTSTLAAGGIGSSVGLNISTYEFPGGDVLHLLPSDHLALGTPQENWCIVMAMENLVLKTSKDFVTKEVTNPDVAPTSKREYEYAIEWQGSLAVHNEPTFAVLRTWRG